MKNLCFHSKTYLTCLYYSSLTYLFLLICKSIRYKELLLCVDEFVYVKLKAYNSYCVDKLWIGFPSAGRKEGSMDPVQIKFMKVNYI